MPRELTSIMGTARLLVCFLAACPATFGYIHGNCSEKRAMKENEVAYVISPGYGHFPRNSDCYYEFYTAAHTPGLVVHVDVLEVTLSCDDEGTQLRVYGGYSPNSPLLGKICVGGLATFQSPKQTLYITFRSRDQPQDGRYRLRIRTEPKYNHCYMPNTAVLTVTTTPAILTTPTYPYGVEANVNCRWLLRAPNGYRVNATLLAVDMKGSLGCHHFGFYVYDGKSTYDYAMLAKVCDNSIAQWSFQSSGPYMLFIFTSGSMVYGSGDGIKLQYSISRQPDTSQQLIGQTIFLVITSLLLTLIFFTSLFAFFKLFIVPRRRNDAERAHRATRLQNSISQSDQQHPSCLTHNRLPRSRGTRMNSSRSGNRRHSLTRLLSLYGPKLFRQDSRQSAVVLESSAENSRGSVVGDDVYWTGGWLNPALDTLPTYEEVMAQSARQLEEASLSEAALGRTTQQAAMEETETPELSHLQGARTEEELRDVTTRQDIVEQASSEQTT